MSKNLATRLSELEQGEIPGCSVSKIIADLDEDTRRILKRVLDGPASTRSIWQALKQDGYKIDRTTIQLHRSKRCVCGEENES